MLALLKASWYLHPVGDRRGDYAFFTPIDAENTRPEAELDALITEKSQ